MPDKSTNNEKVAVWLGDANVKVELNDLTAALDAIYAAGPDSNRIAEAQKRLRQTMAEINSTILYYDIMGDSPIGSILIAVGEQGIVAIEIGVPEGRFISRLESKFEALIVHSPGMVARVIEQLAEYFRGQRSTFDLDISFEEVTPFQRQVLLAAMEVPHGHITTYGEIARRMGKAKSARAVGQALARNPLPIVIPCHRVLGADGSLHGYSGGRGIETKEQLLNLEGVTLN